MLKGIIFDLDGVITDTAKYHFQAWKELGEKLNIKIDKEFNEKLKGVSRMDSLNLILEHYGLEDNYSEEEKIKLATMKNLIYQELIGEVTPEDLLPGISLLLQEAQKENIKMAIASASHNGPFLLKKLEIEDYFDVVVDPAELKNGKPNPEIFLKATELLSLKTNEVVGIEDALAGIESINNAGIFSIAVGDMDLLSTANVVESRTDNITLSGIKKELKDYSKI